MTVKILDKFPVRELDPRIYRFSLSYKGMDKNIFTWIISTIMKDSQKRKREFLRRNNSEKAMLCLWRILKSSKKRNLKRNGKSGDPTPVPEICLKSLQSYL